MTRARAVLPWLLPYALSVALTKGVALVTIPLITGHLSPVEFARLELVATIVEIAGLALAFCAADLMHRFVGAGGAQARANAAAITGALVVLATGACIASLAAASALRPFVGGLIDADLLMVGLFAAALTSCIEAPLAWLRCEGRANSFLAVCALRAFAQTGLMAITLTQGHGAFGVMAGNASVDATIALGLVLTQQRQTGLRLDAGLVREAARYGWPLMAAGVVMFALGNCDRFFLAHALAPQQLAHYALAGKLAVIVALAMQPFGLWWNARRLEVYAAPGGPARSAQCIRWGFACLACGVAWVSLCAPPLVEALLPSAYAPAGKLIPLIAVSVALNECCSLANLSAYRQGRTMAALKVNGAGACVALIGYTLLTPAHGVAGALVATWLGHGVRLAAFLVHGARHAPMGLPWGAFATMAGAVACACALSALAVPTHAPPAHVLLTHMMLAALASGAVLAVALRDARPLPLVEGDARA